MDLLRQLVQEVCPVSEMKALEVIKKNTAFLPQAVILRCTVVIRGCLQAKRRI